MGLLFSLADEALPFLVDVRAACERFWGIASGLGPSSSKRDNSAKTRSGLVTWKADFGRHAELQFLALTR